MTDPLQPDLFGGAIGAAIFDLDGVITDTASVHAAAWKKLFDGYLSELASRDNVTFVQFSHSDYLAFVDGKPRYEGVQSFLESRDIDLAFGASDDPPDAETVCGLGNRKNLLFRQILAADGPQVFPTSVALLKALRKARIKTGCVSSSRNCRFVLGTVGLLDHFDEILDGDDATERGLRGKPAPDTYLDCANRLGVVPAAAAMIEDALSGVASGAAGGFAHVIGVNRGAGRDELLSAGATVVVDDLGVFL